MNRRDFLWRSGGGLGGLALAHLLGSDGTGGVHHPAKAKRVVQFFMSGAASQVDTFDYKPELIRRHGQKFDPGGKVELFQSSPGACMKSPWNWQAYGNCGKYLSDLVPHIGSCADDICFFHSMMSKSNVHGPATFMQNSGFVLPGFPAMGAWVSYGLGRLTDDLPSFVVLPDSHGADNAFPRRSWDSHENLKKDHGEMGASMDRPAAALLKDLKARGLLDDTIVYWTTEFGRMPCSQGSLGRDHNPFTFTSWVAGGGFKGGISYGESDEWSYKAAVNPIYGYDLHATILHLLGIDHEKLTFRHNGIDRRLTDVHGHVIREVLA